MNRRVVITGLGAVTPLSCRVDELWTSLLAGRSGIHPLQLIDTAEFKIKFGGDILNWDPKGHIDPKEVKRIDRFSQFALVAAIDAMRDSGLELEREDRTRIGAIIGSGIGGLSEIEEQMARLFSKGPDRVSPFTVPKMMLNAAGGNIAIHLGLRGPNYSLATACASATNAIGDALRAVQRSEADVVVTGGSEAAMTRMGLAAFTNIRALSERNDAPERASRPFDRDRDGFVLSEGAGILIFEELEHAVARKARIYAEVFGFGSSCDAGHITQPDEAGLGAAQAMSMALKDAALPPSAIDYVNAHGTSTPLGDKAETIAMKRVFGEHARSLSISSTKSAIGHSLGASGGIELVVCAKSLESQWIHPTVNLENPDPDCDLDYTPLQPRQKTLRFIMSNSFGFGGHNASVIIGAVRDRN
jgi:3-oxoacyl-[acyl-carrier-protein] synthase II